MTTYGRHQETYIKYIIQCTCYICIWYVGIEELNLQKTRVLH